MATDSTARGGASLWRMLGRRRFRRQGPHRDRWLIGHNLLGASPSASAPGTSSTSPSASPAGSPAGGTDTPASPTVLTSSRTPSLDAEFAENPCAVLSDEEIEAAAGGAVISAQGIADRVQPFCRWLLSPSAADRDYRYGDRVDREHIAVQQSNRHQGRCRRAWRRSLCGSDHRPDSRRDVRTLGRTRALGFQVLDPRFTTQVDFRNAFNVRAQAIAEEIARLALERI